jgi:hypothetical protein
MRENIVPGIKQKPLKLVVSSHSSPNLRAERSSLCIVSQCTTVEVNCIRLYTNTECLEELRLKKKINCLFF